MSAEYSVESLQHLILSQHASTSVEAIAALRAFQERIKADGGAVTDEVVEHACKVMGRVKGFYPAWPEMRAALLAVWPNPPAQAAQETPCSLNEALAVIEAWADRGNRLYGDDVPRLRAIADRIAPAAEPVAQGEVVDVKQTAEYSYGYQQALQDTAAQPRAVPKLDAEDWAVLQRLRNALPDVGLNGWHRGVTVLSKLLAAAPSPEVRS